MKKFFYLALALPLFVVVLLVTAPPIFAGGCCYLNYSILPGIAHQEPAKVTTAFTNPSDPYTDETMTVLKPITNQKVTIKILNPIADQSCSMTSDTTNAEGNVSAQCSSVVPGDIKVVFTLADNPGGINEILNTVPLTLHFDGKAVPNPTPAVKSRPILPPQAHFTTPPTDRNSSSPSPTPITVVNIQNDQDQNVAEMKQKITQLETEVQDQKKEVNGLRAKVDELLLTISKFFHFKE